MGFESCTLSCDGSHPARRDPRLWWARRTRRTWKTTTRTWTTAAWTTIWMASLSRTAWSNWWKSTRTRAVAEDRLRQGQQARDTSGAAPGGRARGDGAVGQGRGGETASSTANEDIQPVLRVMQGGDTRATGCPVGRGSARDSCSRSRWQGGEGEAHHSGAYHRSAQNETAPVHSQSGKWAKIRLLSKTIGEMRGFQMILKQMQVYRLRLRQTAKPQSKSRDGLRRN